MYLFFGDFLAGAPYQKKIWWPKFPNDYETLIHHVPPFRMMQWFFQDSSSTRIFVVLERGCKGAHGYGLGGLLGQAHKLHSSG